MGVLFYWSCKYAVGNLGDQNFTTEESTSVSALCPSYSMRLMGQDRMLFFPGTLWGSSEVPPLTLEQNVIKLVFG